MRTFLFVPGDQPKLFAKALASRTDAILFDLEDAVQPTRRGSAREMVSAWISTVSADSRPQLWVRINGVETPDHPLDVDALSSLGIDGVALPKFGDPASFDAAARLPWPVLGIVETARGLIELPCARELPRNVVRLGFGSGDFSADIGTEWMKNSSALMVARAQMVWATRALGLPPPVDTAFPWLDDPEGFAEECRQGRDLGFGGKFCIHPAQLEPVAACWTPSSGALANARLVVDAWDRESAEGKGSFRMDGQMIDEAVVKRARQMLDLARSAADESSARAGS